jgi:adenosylcobinamide-GDP ribazoletransferase
VAAAIVVVADLALTGLLHVDGLADSADGLLPPLDRARRLEVMAAPDTGAFGVAVVAVVVLLRWVALATVTPSVPLLAALWCASRTAMALTTLTQPYVGGGLAAAFLPAAIERLPLALLVGGGGMFASVVLAGVWRVVAGVVAVAAGALAAALVVTFARRRVGGFTGDVLGATGMVSETVGLVVAAAKW